MLDLKAVVQDFDSFERRLARRGAAVAAQLEPVKKLADHPMWAQDAKMTPFKMQPKYGLNTGYAGPPNRQSGEVVEKYIIVDMCARAARGEDPKAIAEWGQKELENVYNA